MSKIHKSPKELERALELRFELFRKKGPKGLKVGSWGVHYASYHEFGTRWSNRMPYGFWKAVRGRKARSASKNVMEFSGKGKDRMARLKARPFLRPAFEQHKDRIVGLFAKAVSNDPQSMENVLTRIGTILQTQISRNVRRPPKPEGGARGPIANSGHLLNSIRYEIMR